MPIMTRKVVKLLFASTILIFILYHLCVIIFSGIKTETARFVQVFDSIDAQAYVIRDEKIIKDDLSGFVNFTLTDADKIEKNGVIALVYSSENQGLLSKKSEIIKNEINRLENLKNFGFALSSTPSSIDQQAYWELNNFIKNTCNYEFNKLSKRRNNILYLLSERQIVAGQNLNLSEKISQLSNELKQINSQINGNVKKVLAEESGFFVGNTDGHESDFDYDNVLKITNEQVDSLLKGENSRKNNKNSAKLVTNSKWFVVCNLKKDDALQLNVDQYVELFMPLASANRLKAKVVAINQLDKNSPAAIVFQCDDIDKNILSIRNEPIKINIAEYKGISVSKSAVHEKKLSRTIVDDESGKEKTEEKLVKGVYIKHGKQLVFKEIDIIFSADDYVICNANENKSKLFSENTIKEHDEIVVKGKDLYDGKFV